MGFEPFIPPKKVVEKNVDVGNRDDRILGLAQLLHSRGLTASLADAKRLAAGMVDVEKKVIKQSPSPTTNSAPQTTLRSTIDVPKTSLNMPLTLHNDFAEFVAKVAPMGQETEQSNVEKTVQKTEERKITELPKIGKQLFFDDAPSITEARGYSGSPKPQRVHYQSQREGYLKTTTLNAEQNRTTITRVEQTPVMEIIEERTITPEGVKTTVSANTPQAEVIEEKIVVEDTKEENHSSERKPTAQELLRDVGKDETSSLVQPPHLRASVEENNNEATRGLDPSENVAQKQEQNNVSGAVAEEKKPALPTIDLFDFFKKKS